MLLTTNMLQVTNSPFIEYQPGPIHFFSFLPHLKGVSRLIFFFLSQEISALSIQSPNLEIITAILTSTFPSACILKQNHSNVRGLNIFLTLFFLFPLWSFQPSLSVTSPWYKRLFACRIESKFLNIVLKAFMTDPRLYSFPAYL